MIGSDEKFPASCSLLALDQGHTVIKEEELTLAVTYCKCCQKRHER